MEFRILGPLEVVDGERVVAIGAGKQRALLAVLLLHANEVVTSERLIDKLWDDGPPPTAAKSIHVYVSQIRKAMRNGGPSQHDDAGVLLTQAGGYVLRVEPREFDVRCFERAVEDGRLALGRNEPERAAERLREGLRLWRGPPLADFRYDAFAQAEIARLEELRLGALEERIEADLAVGHHTALVGELETLVADDPLRERLRGLLMVALYRCDRQAEALDVYRRGRRELVEQLGLEPSRTLQRLEQSILAQDPDLAAPAGGRELTAAPVRLATAPRPPLLAPPAPASPTIPRGPPRAPPVHGRRALLGAGVVTLLAVVAAAAVKLLSPTPTPATRIAAPLSFNAVAAVDGRSGAITAAVPVPGRLGRIAVGDGAVWVGSDDSRTVSAVDPRTERMSRTVAAGIFPSDIASGDGAVWVVDGHRGVLEKIHPGYGRVTDRVALHRRANGRAPPADRFAADPTTVAVGAGGVWVTDGSDRLLRIDPGTARIVARVAGGRSLRGVAVGAGAVWAIGAPAVVLRIDPATDRVTDRIAIVGHAPADGPYPIAVAAAGRFVWVLNGNTATVTKIDARTRGIVQTLRAGVDRGPRQIAAGPDAAWVAADDGTLTHIDARTGAMRSTPVGRGLRDVGVAGDTVWVTNQLTDCCGQE
ncbi:MAG: hypothetical protein QOF29_2898 [bacterium]